MVNISVIKAENTWYST